ncbi:DUF418 domain-containing protein [Aquipuribacter sp. SD81]|uniref:DUF418 domain-containing protein n=1 Tax=Aquipuribacter sp. SD81 TaxID=3127703 RepID=UPI00301899B7
MVAAVPEPRRVRALDVARGVGLLGAAVGTATLWLDARRLGPGYRPAERGDVDRLTDLVTALLVDNRVLPLFAVVLGAALALRVQRDGARATPVVLRRAAVLLGLGLLHATLVLEADVLGVLAVLLVLGLPLVRARRRWWVVACVAVLPALVLHGAADGVGGSAGFPDPPADYVLSVVDRTGTWLLGLVLLPLAQAGPLVGVVAGVALVRGGWLQRPEAHRRGLVGLAVVGLAVGLAGAVPYARVVAGPGAPDLATSALAGVASSVSGPAGAVGLVALLALLVPRAPRELRAGRGPGALEALERLGRHSLAAYLATSAVLAVVLAPWALGAGARWGTTATALLAAGTWGLSLVVVLLVRSAPWAAGGRGTGPAQPSERQGLERSSAT